MYAYTLKNYWKHVDLYLFIRHTQAHLLTLRPAYGAHGSIHNTTTESIPELAPGSLPPTPDTHTPNTYYSLSAPCASKACARQVVQRMFQMHAHTHKPQTGVRDS